MSALPFTCLDDYDPNALSVQRARQFLLETVEPVSGHERVFIRQALGRVLAEDVISPLDVPAHDNAAMDGWAVRHADVSAARETRLKVVGTAFAGRPFGGKLGANEAARIMTGAPIPPGADCVVIQEIARVDGEEVIIPPGQQPGQNIRLAGEDLQAGKPALVAGKRLRPAELGVIASLGIAEVVVRRRVRVALFSTGDELVSVGTPPAHGSVYDSNRYTLWGMLTRLGCEVIDMGVVKDDPAALEAALREAAGSADAIVTSGGVSVGEADFIKQLMNRLGEVAFWKIAMKPGKPMAFGRIGTGKESAWLFGLPGNPVAVMTTFYQFAQPALLKLMGMAPVPEIPTFTVRCVTPIKKGKGRTEFQRGVLFQENGEWCVQPTGQQGSGILSSMAKADCFIVLDAERGNVAAGETVAVQVFEGLV